MISKKINGAEYTFNSVQELIDFEKALREDKQPEIRENKTLRPQILDWYNIIGEVERKHEENSNLRLSKILTTILGRKPGGTDFENYRKYGGIKFTTTLAKTSQHFPLSRREDSWKSRAQLIREYILKHPRKKHCIGGVYKHLFKSILGSNINKLKPELDFTGIDKIGKTKYRKTKYKKIEISDKKPRGPSLEYRNFISTRTKFYLRQPYNWDYMKALTMAKDEWGGKRKIRVDEPQTTFEEKRETKGKLWPSVYPIAEASQPILKQITEHMIQSAGKLAYPQVRDSLKIIGDVNNGEWCGRVWGDFIGQFLQNSNNIATFFGVKNNFKYTKDENNYDIIIYKSAKNL